MSHTHKQLVFSMNKIKTALLSKTKNKRTIFFLAVDTLLISLSCYAGFFLRFDGVIDAKYAHTIIGFTALTVTLIIFLFWIEKLYSVSWSFISIKELLKLSRAILIGFAIITATLFLLRDDTIFTGFPRSIIFITGFLVLLTTGAFRISKRIYLNGIRKEIAGKERVLIFGAGNAGEQLVRSILRIPESNYFPIGFVDDDPLKQGMTIHGVKVLGKRADITKIVMKHDCDVLIIALPSAPQDAIREAVKLAKEAGVTKIKILPSTLEILDEKVSLTNVRNISIEDLLGRKPVTIEMEAIKNFISNKSVLVTGAAGSIGSYLCQQILKFSPEKLIAIDQDETGIFNLKRKLKTQPSNSEKRFIIGDIRSKNKMNQIFEKYKPQIVFHAAAYKHVPLMESNPDEAVKNNVFGTKTIVQTALNHKVEKFIFISTDKAVNPTSVIGMNKRMGEMICQQFNKKEITKFVSVRFGNVLDSRGNVIHIFRDQIAKRGPVEVTHPDMKRYFMITAEAVLLVMQAGAMGEGGEVFVLDMGEPIKIVDLAKEMIKLSGFEPDVDIPIVFTQTRPGEKLFENILTAEEGTVTTKNQSIFMAKLSGIATNKFEKGLKKLKKAVENSDYIEITNALQNLTSSCNSSRQHGSMPPPIIIPHEADNSCRSQ